MIIFLEGPDGSGKTTLLHELNAKFGYEIAICPERNSDKLKERNSWLNFIYDYENRIVICDRSFISEFVYRLYDQSQTYLRLCDLITFLQESCKFIFCDTDTSFTDAQDRGEDNITTYESHCKIRRLYCLVFDILSLFEPSICKMKYDWHKQDAIDVVKFINSNPQSHGTI